MNKVTSLPGFKAFREKKIDEAKAAAASSPVLVVTLTKVSYSASLSEETSAFTAIVSINGKTAFHVSNHGTGGCNDHSPLKGQTYDEMRAELQRLNAYAATLPPDTTYGSPLAIDADWMIDDALNAYLEEKDFDRMTRSNVVMIEGGRVYTLKIKKPWTPNTLTPDQRDNIQKKNSNAEILNWLPREVALEKYRAVARAAG